MSLTHLVLEAGMNRVWVADADSTAGGFRELGSFSTS